MTLVWILLIGAIAGYLAGMIMKGGGYGLVGNIIIGIVGSVIGGYLLGMLGVSLGGGLAGTIITAVIGAVVLLAIARMIKK